MNERIEQLESSVRRWKRVCLALVLVILCLLAGGGTVIGLLMRQLPGHFDFMFPWTRQRLVREELERNLLDDVRAMEAIEAERKAARQQEKGPPVEVAP
jgi:hypothetical protein